MGRRRGETLALRFADVDLSHGLITLRGETTKSRKTRLVPISTQRLRTVVEWLRQDADGYDKPQTAHVFSNEVGEPLLLFHNVWQVTVLRAHGVPITWSAQVGYKGLSRECKAAYRRIDLRWRDLRHEYASRLVEKGVPLAQVRDLLGHASITTTERYDTQTIENLQVAVTKLERGVAFDVPTTPLPALTRRHKQSPPTRQHAEETVETPGSDASRQQVAFGKPGANRQKFQNFSRSDLGRLKTSLGQTRRRAT